MSEPKPDSPLVLEYATPSADGLPEWIDDVETLIDDKVHPRKLRKHFRKAEDAASYFAKSMARRFGIENHPHLCVNCDVECMTVVPIIWKVRVPHKFFEFTISSKIPERAFKTFYPLCADCYRQWEARTRRWGIVRRITQWVSTSVSLGFFLVVIIRNFLPGGTRGWAGDDWIWIFLILAPLVTALFLAVSNAVLKSRVPRTIRRSMPGGVQYVSVEELVTRYDPSRFETSS